MLSIVAVKGADLVGKRIAMFSYGSGSAASLYSLVGRKPFANVGNENFTLENIQKNTNAFQRLHEQRNKCSVAEFTAALDVREKKYSQV